jgi:hypothetical protein
MGNERHHGVVCECYGSLSSDRQVACRYKNVFILNTSGMIQIAVHTLKAPTRKMAIEIVTVQLSSEFGKYGVRSTLQMLMFPTWWKVW